jgi:hypothetical protein
LDPESLSTEIPEPKLTPLNTRRMLTPSPLAHSDILVLVSLLALTEHRALYPTKQSPALVGHCFLSRRKYAEDHRIGSTFQPTGI